jgi:adenosine deaminase
MSGSGNGIDIAAVYQLLARVAETVGTHSTKLDNLTRVVNDHTLLLHEHGGRLADIESGQTSLRQAVVDYHSSVIGHGILISELDHRVRRIEEHLHLPPIT